jgi:hypothetical protein
MVPARHRAPRAWPVEFVWVNVLGCAPAVIGYEIAATHALRGDRDQALEALDTAARLGWADLHQLEHDPCFDDMRHTATLRALLARATSLVMLPPPVGSGGFPELEPLREAGETASSAG